MGPDGHTASFFPGGDRLAEALDPANTAEVVPMRADGAGEPRITLTLPVLVASRALYLHIEGRDKRAVLEQAEQADSALPISSILRHAPQLKIYWCP
jgi:6-phosphogluconolactonase